MPSSKKVTNGDKCQKRNFKLPSPSVKQPLAPQVRPGLELPYDLRDWNLLGDQWFESNVIDYIAYLPDRGEEFAPYPAFTEGAVRVVELKLQKSITTPFILREVHSEDSRKLNMPEVNASNEREPD